VGYKREKKKRDEGEVMSAASEKPSYQGGRNIAIKVPPHEWEQTVAFYRDILGLPELGDLPSTTPTVVFQFGSNRLWVDRVKALSQAEIWLEVSTSDVPAAARHLKEAGVVRRDEIEALDFEAFWVSSPAGIIHLVAGEGDI
jgi:catechol 2,3-dioxygenase-like lactoylglutathione lyase family enzyme